MTAGSRSQLYNWLYTVFLAGVALGPAFSAVIFLVCWPSLPQPGCRPCNSPVSRLDLAGEPRSISVGLGALRAENSRSQPCGHTPQQASWPDPMQASADSTTATHASTCLTVHTIQEGWQHSNAGRGVLLQVVGNQWTPSSLRLVLLVGMGLSLVPAAISFFFDDGQALGASSEGLLASPELQQAAEGDARRLRLTMLGDRQQGLGSACSRLQQAAEGEDLDQGLYTGSTA